MPDGPAPWGIRAASTVGEGASLAQDIWNLIVSFLKPPLNALPVGSPSLGRPARPRTVLSPENRSTSTGTKPSGKPYISPPSADKQGEGATRDYVDDTDHSSKEHIARLVEQAKQGRADAFGEIYHLYHEALFRYAKFRLGKHAAEDAVAETFLRAWQGLPRYRATGAPFVSWLYGIARHVVLDAGVAERKVELRGEFMDYAFEPSFGTVDNIALADAIQALPPKQRQVIEMKFIIGMTNEEAGGALKKSPGAVNALQWRALETLRKIMEKTWRGDES